ncbi:MAG TPA: ATP-binding protein [Gaiellaceae bacterium]|nr:ATP-binding protein [Gaiellaceae bacterium]
MANPSFSIPRANGDAPTVRLTIPAKPEYISLVRLALSGLSQTRELPDETLGDLKLAVTEACSNSVRHAYGEGREGSVEVVYELHPDRLVVEVSDDGAGFSEAEPPPVDVSALNEGGLGIAIIRELADELELGRKGDGQGSRLRLVKFIQA